MRLFLNFGKVVTLFGWCRNNRNEIPSVPNYHFEKIIDEIPTVVIYNLSKTIDEIPPAVIYPYDKVDILCERYRLNYFKIF